MNIQYIEPVPKPVVTPPEPWTAEKNMPPQAWFKGEWWAAKQARLAREREEARKDRLMTILAKVTLVATGVIMFAGSFAGFMAMLWIAQR